MSSKKPKEPSSKAKDATSPKDKDTSHADSESEISSADLLKLLKKAQKQIKQLGEGTHFTSASVATDIPAPVLAGFTHTDFSLFNRLRTGYLSKCKLKRLMPDPIHEAFLKFEPRVMAAVGIKDRDPVGTEWLMCKEEVIMAKLSTHFYAKASLAEIQNLYRAVKLIPYTSYPALVDSLDRFEVDVTVLDRDLARAQCQPLDPVTRREILQSRLLKSTELAYFLRNQKFETFDALLEAARAPVERLAAFHREFGPAEGAPGTLVPGIQFLALSKSKPVKPVSLNAIDPSEEAVPPASSKPPTTKRSKRRRGNGRTSAPQLPDTIDTDAITQAVVNALRGVASDKTRKGGQFTPSHEQLTQRPCYSCDGKSHTMERCFVRQFANKATGKCDISKLSQAQRAILQEKIAEQRSSSPRRSGKDTPAREPSATRRHGATSSDESVNDDDYSSSCVCARLVLGSRAVASSLLDTGTTHNFVDPEIAAALGEDILRKRKVSRLIRAGGSLVGSASVELLLQVCRERHGKSVTSLEWFIVFATGHDAIIGLPTLTAWTWVSFDGVATCTPATTSTGSSLQALSLSRRAKLANRNCGSVFQHTLQRPRQAESPG
jgi:hypothetical protein